MGLRSYLDFDQLEVKGQRVFLRLDLNVPIKDGKVMSDNRIKAALPTIRNLLERGARLIVASHLGRPKTEEDQKKFSLEPVAEYLSDQGLEVLLMETPDSEAPYELSKSLTNSKIILLENLRFAPGETKNSQDLAAKWSRYTDIYINDAFGACHRAHASIEALPRLVPHRAYGPLVAKEIKALEAIRNEPAQPFTLVTGGSKVSDKLPLLESFSDKVSSVVIGGGMAYTFLKVQGFEIGNSLLEKDQLKSAERFLKRMESLEKKVLLPVDHVAVQSLDDPSDTGTLCEDLKPGWMGVDIGPQSQTLFTDHILQSRTVFWNGPMGIYERPPFDKGSVQIARAIAESSAFSVVGGGDSAAAALDSGYAKDMDHISTGGGASLEFIQGVSLPGLEALRVRLPEE